MKKFEIGIYLCFYFFVVSFGYIDIYIDMKHLYHHVCY